VTGDQQKAKLVMPLRWWHSIPIVVVAMLCFTGCVRRRMTIRTDPPGAMVYVDDYEIGTTPVSTNFTYYGTRKIRIVKEGYETLTFLQPIPTPWYEIPPLDFFSENLLPGELRDRRTLYYRLRPQVAVPDPQLRGRAEDLRARGRAPLAEVPAGFTQPAPVDAVGPPPPVESIPAPQGQPQASSQTQPPFPVGAQPIVPAQPQTTPGAVPLQGGAAPGAWTPPPGPGG